VKITSHFPKFRLPNTLQESNPVLDRGLSVSESTFLLRFHNEAVMIQTQLRPQRRLRSEVENCVLIYFV